MFLWMVLSALLYHAKAACPAGCECSEAALTVKCVAKDLQKIPTDIPGFTRNLFIIGNQIHQIGPESFKGLDNVTTLSLSNNRISRIESHTFAGLRSLRSLDLSSNQLAVIHPEAFSVPSRSLRDLNLGRALYNHSAMRDLATALRWSALTGLQSLDLSGNGLIYLPEQVFSHLGSLRRLQLANNSLVALHNGSLTALTRLEDLDLSLNAFRTFREEALRELDRLPWTRFHLALNPYTCTCGIEPFANWLNESRTRVADAERLTCAFPIALRNTSILSLAEGDGSGDAAGVGTGRVTLGCHRAGEGPDLALQTSYVFLGIVLGFVGLMFLFVLYLNRKGIKKRIIDMRDACREVWEGYHYRYEIDSDPRLSHISSADV